MQVRVSACLRLRTHAPRDHRRNSPGHTHRARRIRANALGDVTDERNRLRAGQCLSAFTQAREDELHQTEQPDTDDHRRDECLDQCELRALGGSPPSPPTYRRLRGHSRPACLAHDDRAARGARVDVTQLERTGRSRAGDRPERDGLPGAIDGDVAGQMKGVENRLGVAGWVAAVPAPSA